MTRKDYVLIAGALLRGRPEDPNCTVAGSAALHGQHMRDCKALADALAGTNPRFDRERFLRACGVAS